MSAPEPRDGDSTNTPEAHPRGALAFILIYLVLVVAFWVNTYLRLWIRG